MGIGAVAKTVGSSTIGRGGIIISILRLLMRYWFVVLTIFSFMFLLWSSVVQSFKESSFQPFIDQVGSKVFLIDFQLYNYLSNTVPADTLLGSVLQLVEIISGVWLLFFAIFGLAWLIGHSPFSNDSAKFINWALAIIFIFFISTSYCLSNNELVGFEDENQCYRGFPGIRKLASEGLDFLSPIKEYLLKYSDKRLDLENASLLNDSSFNSTEVINWTSNMTVET